MFQIFQTVKVNKYCMEKAERQKKTEKNYAKMMELRIIISRMDLEPHGSKSVDR